MNILISSAGRRVILARNFQTELRKYFSDAKVYTADSKWEISSACQANNGISLSKLTEPNFIDPLINICIKKNIKLIIPTIDTELLIYAKNKEKLMEYGIDVIVPSKSFVERNFSKISTKEFFSSFGFLYPQIYDKSNFQYPIIAKPEFGSSSANITIVKNKDELSESLVKNKDLIFFEYLDNKIYTEFTVDLYYDKNSRLKCAVPRQRIETRGGEVTKGVTRKNQLYEKIMNKMQIIPGVVGCINIQFFVSNNDEKIYGIECNPRFGGGYPLSYKAGANFPNWLIREYFFNEEIELFENWEEDLLMLRYDDAVFVNGYTGK